jgi:hypothetical protein
MILIIGIAVSTILIAIVAVYFLVLKEPEEEEKTEDVESGEKDNTFNGGDTYTEPPTTYTEPPPPPPTPEPEPETNVYDLGNTNSSGDFDDSTLDEAVPSEPTEPEPTPIKPPPVPSISAQSTDRTSRSHRPSGREPVSNVRFSVSSRKFVSRASSFDGIDPNKYEFFSK